MHFRYTIEELKTMTDAEFLAAVLRERKSTCTNYYSPLSVHLKGLIDRVEKNAVAINDALAEKQKEV